MSEQVKPPTEEHGRCPDTFIQGATESLCWLEAGHDGPHTPYPADLSPAYLHQQCKRLRRAYLANRDPGQSALDYIRGAPTDLHPDHFEVFLDYVKAVGEPEEKASAIIPPPG